MNEAILPHGWAMATVGDLADYVNGRAFKPTEWKDAGKPIIRIQNLNKDDAKYNFSPENHEEKYLVRNGDLLFAWSASLGAYIWHGGDAWLNQHIFIVHPKKCTTKLFVFYLLEKITAELYAKAHGSGMVHVTKGKFESTEISLPPLNEQQRIVAKIEELFSELDKGIENLKTARAQLKVYRQALLKHAFEGKLTVQWRAENHDRLETAAALQKRIQQERAQRYQQQLADWQSHGGSKPKAPRPLPPLTAEELAELPVLPEGWGRFKVGEICDVVRGGSPRPAGDPKFYGGSIPFLKVADITTTATPYLNTYTYTITEAGLSKTRQIDPYTLLLSNSGATLGVPKICLIAATMNDGVAAFLGLPQEVLLYHYYFWQSKTEQLRNIDQGAAQPNLNTDLIKETLIPICSQSEQIAVAQKLEEALSEVDQLEQTLTTSLQQAEALRQSILKRAFSGQLVPQDPHDEPASVLLARIRAERAGIGDNAASPRKAKKVSA